MNSCDLKDTCRFFREETCAKMPKLVKTLKERYCLGNCAECARYILAKTIGSEYVPEFMLPTQTEWAEQILQEYQSGNKNEEIGQSSSYR